MVGFLGTNFVTTEFGASSSPPPGNGHGSAGGMGVATVTRGFLEGFGVRMF